MSEYSRLFSGTNPTQVVLNPDTEDQLTCYGYRANRWKLLLFILLSFSSFGFLLLLMLWRPELECYIKRKKCHLRDADTILIQDHVKRWFVSQVETKGFDDHIGAPEKYNQFGESSDEDDPECCDTTRLKGPEVSLRYFDHQHVRYLWELGVRSFVQLRDLSHNTKCSTIMEKFQGLSKVEQAQKQVVYGANLIDVEVKSYWRLFIEEVMNPFYIFQIFSIVLWLMDDYYYYAACIFLISVISICISLHQIKKQSIALHDMVAVTEQTMEICLGQGRGYEKVPTSCLVPGDLIVLPQNGCTMTCDAVLVTGTCIVNESMLTGESVPVTKTPLTHQEDEEVYSPEIHKRHTLFSGTHIMQTRYYGSARVTAVVVRTGFRTAKGELVRSILFPKPVDFKFYRDAMKFIMFLGFIAALGMIYTVVMYVKDGIHPFKIVLRVLDVITIIVPAALPAAMTIGITYAQNRLKKESIYCISPPRINFGGRLDAFCFDKTGTLTEDGLDMMGTIPVHKSSFLPLQTDPSKLDHGPVLNAMATCHSLTIMEGELSGDPLDLIMFESTKWVLEEPGRDTSKFDTMMPTVVKPCTRDTFLPNQEQPPLEIGIIRQFTFSSNMQRMSVITRELGKEHMELYCKGAPEKIISLCVSSTVPTDIKEILQSYTLQGHRVIALAWRPLDPKLTWHQSQRISRDKVEKDMTFLGLIVMQNKLKPQTRPVIRKLIAANIRCVMITGDMIETAMSVARNCGMVSPQDKVIIVEAVPPDHNGPARVEYRHSEMPTDRDTENTLEYSRLEMETSNINFHFAINGKSLSVITKHLPDLLPRICVVGTVFARMKPDQKCQLIHKLQSLGYHVGMCGDGANDCEALKAAHVGISLSEAEASIAAPFTSSIPHIECVYTVIREGRAALTTSFACFKYMALYSFIQFVSVMILYSFEANLSDTQFLYIDLVITTSIAIFMGYTKPTLVLVPKRPPGSLVKLSNLLSITVHVLLVAIVQVGALLYLMAQKWYTRALPDEDAATQKCWESTTIFLVSSYLYISVAFCFSRGPPYRKPIYTNIPYLVTLVVLVSFSTMMLLLAPHPILDFFWIMPLWEKDFHFRLVLLAFPATHLVLCWIAEYTLTATKCVKKMTAVCKKKKMNPDSYKYIRNEIMMTDWPPIGQSMSGEEAFRQTVDQEGGEELKEEEESQV
ncbi:cation-transporting ATPase 13A2-like isoform X2 [Mizuhopecten yessoensis]|uniref:cation-transporting ATPase 13A2-like isoform X2 n=1 Tax=Mizuhopecten yessoensis TaxID=6573 RepID=UPI000B45CE62|nr:cation-transporting ATPase 13A2-like isoform X2 [Mizuhopecten yessoensis]XP_021361035.1 cation-transporting ATPase 13A2-like isoform X2 [Mizuhopecten yessoensis]XP_021361036.1 cation-transporting ATPase 13A2-like isoform X2 [Mizuhopecten yessoensis]